MSKIVKIYTDGSCINNKYGGWAYCCDFGNGEIYTSSGSAVNTTNNRMELMAIIQALNFCNINKYTPIIFTDSTYVASIINSGWWANWQKNGKNYKNKDLVDKFVRLMLKLNGRIEHKNRCSNKFLKIVDRLSGTEAAKLLKIRA